MAKGREPCTMVAQAPTRRRRIARFLLERAIVHSLNTGAEREMRFGQSARVPCGTDLTVFPGYASRSICEPWRREKETESYIIAACSHLAECPTLYICCTSYHSIFASQCRHDASAVTSPGSWMNPSKLIGEILGGNTVTETIGKFVYVV